MFWRCKQLHPRNHLPFFVHPYHVASTRHPSVCCQHTLCTFICKTLFQASVVQVELNDLCSVYTVNSSRLLCITSFWSWKTNALAMEDCWYSLVLAFLEFQHSPRLTVEEWHNCCNVTNAGRNISCWWMMEMSCTWSANQTACMEWRPGNEQCFTS